MFQRNFKLCDFPVHSVCFLQKFFLSIKTESSARSLPLCEILKIFTVNFERYLHMREPGAHAQAPASTRNIFHFKFDCCVHKPWFSGSVQWPNKLFRVALTLNACSNTQYFRNREATLRLGGEGGGTLNYSTLGGGGGQKTPFLTNSL